MRSKAASPFIAAAALFMLFHPPAGAEPRSIDPGAVRRYRVDHERDILRELVGLLSVPNLASDTPNIERNAAALTEMLQRRDVATKLLRVQGAPPVVFGELKAKGAKKTIVFYAHYDGQPVDPKQWIGEPWSPSFMPFPPDPARLEPALQRLDSTALLSPEARLYARSASDDKAPIVAALAAIDALRGARIPLSVNLKFFLEGEEEAGSPHLEQILRENADLLKSDLWIFADGPVHQSRAMQVFYGVRGVTTLELTTYGPSRSLHSGHYGNWAPNPAAVLANVIASMRDSDGRILIDGFYDDVRALTGAERAAIAAVPDVDADLRGEFALGATEGGNAPIGERIMLPALNVRGLSSGAVGDRAANAIPVSATASIDFRLVLDQTPAGVRGRVDAHLRKQGFHVVAEEPDEEQRRAHPRLIRAAWGHGYPPARTALDHPMAAAAARAIESATGSLVRLPTLGGSLPIYIIETVLGAPLLGVPIVNHDNNQHGANENLRLQNLWDGIEVYANLLAGLDSQRVP